MEQLTEKLSAVKDRLQSLRAIEEERERVLMVIFLSLSLSREVAYMCVRWTNNAQDFRLKLLSSWRFSRSLLPVSHKTYTDTYFRIHFHMYMYQCALTWHSTQYSCAKYCVAPSRHKSQLRPHNENSKLTSMYPLSFSLSLSPSLWINVV
jgi:hypothetical protein